MWAEPHSSALCEKQYNCYTGRGEGIVRTWEQLGQHYGSDALLSLFPSDLLKAVALWLLYMKHLAGVREKKTMEDTGIMTDSILASICQPNSKSLLSKVMENSPTDLFFFLLKIKLFLCSASASFIGITFLFACIVMEKEVRVVRHTNGWGDISLSAIGWSKELIRSHAMENMCGERRGEQEGSETGKLLNLLALSSCLSRNSWTHLAFVQLICAVQKPPSPPLRDKRHLPVSCFFLTVSCQTLAKLIRHTDRSLWQNKGDISEKEWW